MTMIAFVRAYFVCHDPEYVQLTYSISAFKPNSTNIIVSNMHCNGSHGISVGSLGQYAGETDIVANVSVTDITMLNAENGARIKVFGGNPSPSTCLSISLRLIAH